MVGVPVAQHGTLLDLGQCFGLHLAHLGGSQRSQRLAVTAQYARHRTQHLRSLFQAAGAPGGETGLATLEDRIQFGIGGEGMAGDLLAGSRIAGNGGGGAADMQVSWCLDDGRRPVSCTGMWTRLAEATRRLLIL